MRYFPLIFFVTLLFSSCENDIEKVNLITQKEKLPLESASNAEIVYSDSARVKVKMTAPQLDRYSGDDPYIELPKGMLLWFFDDSMKVKTKLSADYAIRHENKKIMEARKHVVVVNERGEKLETEHLTWDEKEQKIRTKDFVKITTATDVLMGDGLESNQDFTEYKILKPSGTFSQKDSSNVQDH